MACVPVLAFSFKFTKSISIASSSSCDNLTICSRVFLEKLTGSQLVKIFPALYGTTRFITAFTTATTCPYPGGQINPVHISIPHILKPILILSSNLCLSLPSGLFPSSFPTKTLYAPYPLSYALHAQPISYRSLGSLLKTIYHTP